VKTSPHLAARAQGSVGKAVLFRAHDHGRRAQADGALQRIRKAARAWPTTRPRVLIERRPGRITAFSMADHKNDAERRASQVRPARHPPPRISPARSVMQYASGAAHESQGKRRAGGVRTAGRTIRPGARCHGTRGRNAEARMSSSRTWLARPLPHRSWWVGHGERRVSARSALDQTPVA